MVDASQLFGAAAGEFLVPDIPRGMGIQSIRSDDIDIYTPGKCVYPVHRAFSLQ